MARRAEVQKDAVHCLLRQRALRQLFAHAVRVCRACASPGGGCQFLGTAATAQVVAEALGLTLPHAALAPSGQPVWRDLGVRSARAVVALADAGRSTREILTPGAIANAIYGFFSPTNFFYWLFYFLLTAAFTYFYTDVMFRQQNLPDSLQKQGGFIPGIRPGPRTEQYLNNVLARITLVGALFRGFMAV